MRKIAFLILSMNMIHFGWALDCKDLTTLSTEKGRQWTSRAAINPNGSAVVAWITSQDNYHLLQACSRENAHASWSAPQIISEPMNIKIFFPTITIDGACTIIWIGPHQNPCYYAKKESTSPWIPGQIIGYPELTTLKDTVVDFKGDPFVLATYQQESPVYSFHYQYNEKPNKSFRELPKLPKSDEEKTLTPRLITNQQGKIVALWGSFFTPGFFSSMPKDYHFFTSSYEGSGLWNTKTDIGSLKFTNLDRDKVKDISGSLNKENNLTVIWSHFDADSAKYKLKSLINKKTEEIKSSDEGFTLPTILMDDDGNTAAVWIQTFDKKNVVYAAFKPKEKDTWQGDPRPLSNVSNNAQQVQIGFNNGVFVVVWGEANETPYQRMIFGATLAPKAEKFEWTPAVQLSPAHQNCWYPSIAFGEKGGIITWTTHVKRTKDFDIQVANLIAP